MDELMGIYTDEETGIIDDEVLDPYYDDLEDDADEYDGFSDRF